MEITPNETGEGEKRAMLAKRGREDGVKRTRYTEQQIEALEKVYAEFSNPNSFQRAQMLLEQHGLSGLDNKQLKVWFQNRRAMVAKRGREDGVKYTRYTEQQIEALEKVYAEFPNPNSFQWAQMLLEQPALCGLDNKQLKVWFQNRR